MPKFEIETIQGRDAPTHFIIDPQIKDFFFN